MKKKLFLVEFFEIPIIILSNNFRACLTISSWPLVNGSNDPGNNPIFIFNYSFTKKLKFTFPYLLFKLQFSNLLLLSCSITKVPFFFSKFLSFILSIIEL